MSSDRVIFAESAERHGYTVEDVLYAFLHETHRRTFISHGETYFKFTGEYHGDPLVPTIEVMMKQSGSRLVIFHVNAEQDNFWDKD
ncbi:hypothetical protein OZX67_06725 [Bifidobacterium sp. ESL0728]|uniref:hypothetical protein n=1 Tax=Bifidobacterium sp. ESL0728 TaxID=2983220 RepID=UPI0023F63AEC|nr:hypothetical protein [Bifidobacterium sp. ESL0728]WEV58504.1 hypothetical protein OZX67_06725 [Bifidobacterium sp. ESL0728]